MYFHEVSVEGTFQDLIVGNAGKPHDCLFLGEVDTDIAPKDVGEVKKKWGSLENAN